MRVRLVPVGEIFRRMPFVVRDLARETGKRVRLELRGQATEIDKFLIERMMDPVLHLVRNAVSHGIETAGRARRRRQAPRGHDHAQRRDRRRHRRASRSPTTGAASTRRRWSARARAAGLAGARTGTLDARDAARRCSARRASRRATSRTARAAAASAWRVVQAAVEELSGSLTLETTPGAGTRFVIELPVTLAITDALIATRRRARRSPCRRPRCAK